MRWKSLVALAVAVVALGAYIWFVDQHRPTTDELKEQADKVFPGLEQDKIRRLVVSNPHGVFELVKDGPDWKLAAPIKDDANSGAVTNLVSELTSLKAERTLKASGVKLAEYGLDKPTLRLEAVTQDGKKLQLTLGAEMPLGNTRAAMTGTDSVLLVNKYIASDVEKDLAAWRSDQLVRISSTDVAAMTLTVSGARVGLTHTGTNWSLTEPVADLADRERAEGLLTDLGAARIKEFVDTPGPIADYGLEPRTLDITVIRRGEKSAPIALAFGKEREVGGVKQVACKRGAQVVWVEATASGKLTGSPAGWRAKKLVALDTWAADSLEVSAGAAKATLERKDGIWQSGGRAVDFAAVSARLNTLANLEIQSFDQTRPTGQPLGHVTSAVSGGETAEATFYAGSDPTQAIAVVVGRAGAMAVERSKVTDLLDDPTALAKPKPTPAPIAAASPAPTKAK
jgi:hypothetical protein